MRAKTLALSYASGGAKAREVADVIRIRQVALIPPDPETNAANLLFDANSAQ